MVVFKNECMKSVLIRNISNPPKYILKEENNVKVSVILSESVFKSAKLLSLYFIQCMFVPLVKQNHAPHL